MKPHGTDNGSLVFGVLFLGIAAWWLVAQIADVSVGLGAVGWLVAVLLVTVGVVGVVTAIRSGRNSQPPE